MTHSHKQSTHGKHRSHGSHGSSSSGNSNNVYTDGGRQQPVRQEIVWSWDCKGRRSVVEVLISMSLTLAASADVVKGACPAPVLRVATNARCSGVNDATFIRLMFTLTDTKVCVRWTL
ncbi:hypothetical protein VM1G_11971 [Cytospora mali]|uniref:Uncharacterized protein n=1 Tax=Cytospora mali TaxID=578113 RepID=A0A194WDV9_CYTMA|nr:hypothetical protein VM1G_11971 [Valsa mali]